MFSPITEYQKILRMDELIREGTFPSVEKLQEELEVNRRTIFRYRRLLIEDFNAPIEFDKNRNGYFYSVPSFSVNDISLNEDESFALQICKRISTMMFSGSVLYKNFQKGIESLSKRSSIVDREKGRAKSDRVQFAFDYQNMIFSQQKRQKNFEETLFSALENGQILKMNYKYSKTENDGETKIITEEIKVLPLMIVMHGLNWCVLVLKDSTFKNDFSDLDLDLNSFRILQIQKINSILETNIFVKNEISTQSSSMTETANTKGDIFNSGLSFNFKLTFPKIKNSPLRISLTANLDEDNEYYLEENEFRNAVEQD